MLSRMIDLTIASGRCRSKKHGSVNIPALVTVFRKRWTIGEIPQYDSRNLRKRFVEVLIQNRLTLYDGRRSCEGSDCATDQTAKNEGDLI